jgi:hypothetical protein
VCIVFLLQSFSLAEFGCAVLCCMARSQVAMAAKLTAADRASSAASELNCYIDEYLAGRATPEVAISLC